MGAEYYINYYYIKMFFPQTMIITINARYLILAISFFFYLV